MIDVLNNNAIGGACVEMRKCNMCVKKKDISAIYEIDISSLGVDGSNFNP